MAVIEGTQEVVLTVRFRVPPGTPPQELANRIAQYGVSCSVGLMVLAKESKCEVVDIPPPGLVLQQ